MLENELAKVGVKSDQHSGLFPRKRQHAPVVGGGRLVGDEDYVVPFGSQYSAGRPRHVFVQQQRGHRVPDLAPYSGRLAATLASSTKSSSFRQSRTKAKTA